MKRILAAALLAACENPVTHFTDPDEGEKITIPSCTTDTSKFPDMLPPGYQDSAVCRK